MGTKLTSKLVAVFACAWCCAKPDLWVGLKQFGLPCPILLISMFSLWGWAHRNRLKLETYYWNWFKHGWMNDSEWLTNMGSFFGVRWRTHRLLHPLVPWAAIGAGAKFSRAKNIMGRHKHSPLLRKGFLVHYLYDPLWITLPRFWITDIEHLWPSQTRFIFFELATSHTYLTFPLTDCIKE